MKQQRKSAPMMRASRLGNSYAARCRRALKNNRHFETWRLKAMEKLLKDIAHLKTPIKEAAFVEGIMALSEYSQAA